MFTLTVFEILLFEGSSVLALAQPVTGNEGVKPTKTPDFPIL